MSVLRIVILAFLSAGVSACVLNHYTARGSVETESGQAPATLSFSSGSSGAAQLFVCDGKRMPASLADGTEGLEPLQVIGDVGDVLVAELNSGSVSMREQPEPAYKRPCVNVLVDGVPVRQNELNAGETVSLAVVCNSDNPLRFPNVGLYTLAPLEVEREFVWLGQAPNPPRSCLNTPGN